MGSGPKRLGLKYCGGCNPTFSRKELVSNLTASLDFEIIWATPSDENISQILIANGCEVACIEPDRFKKCGIEVLSITEDDEKNLKNLFSKFVLKGRGYDKNKR